MNGWLLSIKCHLSCRVSVLGPIERSVQRYEFGQTSRTLSSYSLLFRTHRANMLPRRIAKFQCSGRDLNTGSRSRLSTNERNNHCNGGCCRYLCQYRRTENWCPPVSYSYLWITAVMMTVLGISVIIACRITPVVSLNHRKFPILVILIATTRKATKTASHINFSKALYYHYDAQYIWFNL